MKGTKKTYKPKTVKSYKIAVKKDAIKTVVKSVLRKQIQTNKAEYSLFLKPIYYSTSGAFNGSIMCLSPRTGELQISQGVGQNARIGNMIKPRKCIFKGIMYPYALTDPLDYNFPVEVKMWIFSVKPTPTTQPALNIEGFFDFNNADQNFTNTLMDHTFANNSDKFTIYKTHTFKLGCSQTTLVQQLGLTAVNNANNDFKMNHKFSYDITKYLPKNIIYNDINNDPMNRHLWCIFQTVNATNVPNLNIASAHVALDYTLSLVYEP